MKSIYKYLIAPFGLIAALCLAIGCSEEYKYDTDYSSYDNVSLKINLVDENDVLSVKLANKTHALTIAVTPEDAFIDPKAYIYELGDNTVASVSVDGTLTLLKVGETTLTVKFRGNKEITTSCKLKVEPTLVSDVIISAGDGIKVEEEKTVDLAGYVAVIPSSADNQLLTYSVKEGYEDMVEIIEGSVVKGLQQGPAIIMVNTTDGSNISKELNLEVTGKIPVSEIKMNGAEKLNGKKVAVGQAFDLATVITTYPVNASNPDLRYTLVSGADAVSMDEHGLITALAAGEVEIKIEAADDMGVAPAQTIKFTVDAAQSWFERALWKIDSSIKFSNGNNYTTDGSNGPLELALDGKAGTYLALTKPGEDYNGHKTPNGHQLFVVVDLTAEQEFNYFQYVHRNNNKNFQVWNLTMYGSNDNENFTLIKKDIPVGPNTTSPFKYEGAIPDAKCRYIKLEFSTFDPTNGYNLCIAEFNVCKK